MSCPECESILDVCDTHIRGEYESLKQQLQVASELLVECKAYVVWHKYGNAVDGEDYSDQLELQKSVDAFLKQINPTRE